MDRFPLRPEVQAPLDRMGKIAEELSSAAMAAAEARYEAEKLAIWAQQADPLAALRALTSAGQQVQQLIDHLVLQLRRDGASWSHIGDLLGLSQHAARRRWRHLELRTARS